MEFKLIIITLLATPAMTADAGSEATTGEISVRTEIYPRPPYSGATYYIYEQSGKIICTTLTICNKYEECGSEHVQGRYKSDKDVKYGNPYSSTATEVIPASKLSEHTCLSRFSLISTG